MSTSSADLVIVLSNLLSVAVGMGLKTFGDRTKLAHEDRKAERLRQERETTVERNRHVSEKEMWQKIGAMDERIAILTTELHQAQQEAAALKVEVALLRKENEQLRAQLFGPSKTEVI